MGCVTKIELETANHLIAQSDIHFEQLNETKNGITDSTYIGIDKHQQRYILKIYEHATLEDVQAEIDILNHLQTSTTPQVLSANVNYYENKPVVMYSYIKGQIPTQITIKQLEEIASFLANMHNCDFQIKTNNIYTKKHMQNMIEKTDKDKAFFDSYFEVIKDLELENNALIHGDLFPDNAKFNQDTLTGVYDFGQSCYGNSTFDIAVVLVSWCFEGSCFNETFAKAFLMAYNKHSNQEFCLETLKPYMLYACLFYALQRYTRVNNIKDYSEFIDKFDILDEQL